MVENNQIYARIPNNFFYNDAELLSSIGGRNSFVLYCLIVSMKNMNDEVYINIKEINNILNIHTVMSKARLEIVKYLNLLQRQELLKLTDNLDTISNSQFITIKWINKFPNKNNYGWAKFYADDFKIHNKIGNVAYCVMWVLRMYAHHEKKVSFISITDITSILKCDRVKVQSSINLFDVAGLFDVVKGEYYYHEVYGRRIKMNNSYKYLNDINSILDFDAEDIKSILNNNI